MARWLKALACFRAGDAVQWGRQRWRVRFQALMHPVHMAWDGKATRKLQAIRTEYSL